MRGDGVVGGVRKRIVVIVSTREAFRGRDWGRIGTFGKEWTYLIST